MNSESDAVILLDHPEASGSAAVRYMYRELDAQISELGRDHFEGLPPEELLSALRTRYGTLAHKIRRKRGQPILEAVQDAFVEHGKPFHNGRFGRTYVIPWSEEAAIEWFRRRLDRSWPREMKSYFLARDLPTLWAACLALDLSPRRQREFADDPFPAPPILIEGPTGTGKELLAKALHLKGGGAQKQLGALNCGGLPTELLESELFGHKRGAFTGAIADKVGFVERYKEGTLFLDEIGDMPPEVQVRLLRFLNTGEFRRLGCNESSTATPRIISATNVQLAKRAETGMFRPDLYHRLRGREIRLRALHERKESIPALVQDFLEREARQKEPNTPPKLTSEAMEALCAYNWPGNMREMKYVIEQLLDARQPLIALDLLPEEIARSYHEQVPVTRQYALTILAAREAGEAPRKLQARVELALQASYGRHISDESTQGASLRRAASLVARIGKALGLEEQLAPQVRLLEAASAGVLMRNFQEQWLHPLRKEFEAHSLEMDAVVTVFNESTELKARKAESAREGLAPEVEKARTSHALAFLVAFLYPLIERAPGALLEKLERAVEIVEVAPLNEAARKLGEWLRTLSPEDLKRKMNDEEEEESLRWEELRHDREKLEAAIQKFGGNASELARVLRVAPETIRRARKGQSSEPARVRGGAARTGVSRRQRHHRRQPEGD